MASSLLQGKHAIVSGANCGIGFQTARGLVRQGASVVLACRRLDAGREAAASLRSEFSHADVTVLPLDLSSLASVRSFAATFLATGRPLHLLVNNAGANWWGNDATVHTDEGVGGCAQLNYLGHVCLTRLLERSLLASAPSRVVTVSSVMHRTCSLASGADRFLLHGVYGGYSECKLAQVLFSYELDRRIASRGVRAVVADPGAVHSRIWRNSPLGQPVANAILSLFYAPPIEGAQAVLHACVADLSQASSDSPEPNRHYFARGLFASSVICSDSWLPQPLWKLCGLLVSIVDQPLRWLSRGVFGSWVGAVRSSPESYDRRRAAELWRISAEVAGLPLEVE
jgi:NAD(P)-dependent dehydrogenase (short-subunit alcohol dehydrogenase family)